MFQKSVLKNVSQDENLVALRWVEYQKYLEKIDYIKKVKEEKFQTEFLQLIFENCLGYTLDSSDPSNFNLEREKKNETDSKKADGVISVNNEIVGVVELKGQDTKNNDTKNFDSTLNIILDSNDEIKQKLEALKNGDTINQYNKNGNNINNNNGSITINNYSDSQRKDINYIEQHPLFKRYIYLEEVEQNNKCLSEIKKSSKDLIEFVKSYNNEFYVKELKRLLIFNHVDSYCALTMEPLNKQKTLDDNYNDREKLIQNQEKVKKLILELINMDF
ncbi:MAG: hypothetical protein U9R37_07985 [Campylobacterota bacterium]|nr:hypothetical protein [Campylobacterota bacterium]